MATKPIVNTDQKSVPVSFSPEVIRKLRRATAVSNFIDIDACLKEGNMLPAFCLPHIISYLHDDLSAITNEARKLGLIP
ncbi:Derepression protein [Plesiomonas shigelloides]|uniref:Derepression protein n=1 Tax=Plesiomonas shigelloides TaxID=703 RepID=UPI001E3A44CB|nr:Derepression protein [Plesiomonas shigelloides]